MINEVITMADRCLDFSYVCIYLILGTSGSNVLYTTETYIGSRYTVGTITLHHDQKDRTHDKKKKKLAKPASRII